MSQLPTVPIATRTMALIAPAQRNELDGICVPARGGPSLAKQHANVHGQKELLRR